MLILSRKTGQSIVLTIDGKEMEVLVHKASKGKVSLAIKAPTSAKILRKELMAGDSK